MPKYGKGFGRLIAGVLGTALLLSGCGGGQTGLPTAEKRGNAGKESGGQNTVAERRLENRTSLAKGRFMEQEISFGENSEMTGAKALLPWGSGLYLIDEFGADAYVELAGRSFARDADPEQRAWINAVSRQDKPEAYRDRLKEDHFVTDTVMAQNGARMYSVYRLEDEAAFDGYFEKYFLSADGRETVWDGGGSVPRDTLVSYACGDDGYFYVLTLDSREDAARKLYRVDIQSGETKYLMEFEARSRASRVIVFGGRLFAVTGKGLEIYDLGTLERAEDDPLLNELLAGSLDMSNGSSANGFLLYPGKDGSIYVVTDQGLYRHVLYGSVSELLIDGEISSLGNISKLFVGMYTDEDGENGLPVFYFLYDNKKLVRFAYDPEASSVPENMITLYSLAEERDVRLLVSAYQALHPDSYVRYEVGVSGQDGVTRDDALSSLATRIAAGEGPDLFVLDDLPYHTYIEKGMLMNLDGLFGELKAQNGFFDNIISALYRGDKLYAIPMMFAVPMFAGKESVLSGITDMDSLVQAVENSNIPEEKYGLRLGLYDAFMVLQALSYTNSRDWLTADGQLDRDALTGYLQWCKRIYDAERAGRPAEILEKRKGIRYDYGSRYTTGQMYRNAFELSSQMIEMLCFGDSFKIGLYSGNVTGDFNYCYDAAKQAGVSYMPMPGAGRTALPFAMLGVNAETPVLEAAKDFVQYALTDYLEECPAPEGIPINRDVLLKLEEPDGSQPVTFGIGFEDPDGNTLMVSIDAAWQDKAVYEEYNAMLDSLDTVNFCEYELLSTVLEEGIPALTGGKSIEEAVNAIAKKIQLYLAE